MQFYFGTYAGDTDQKTFNFMFLAEKLNDKEVVGIVLLRAQKLPGGRAEGRR